MIVLVVSKFEPSDLAKVRSFGKWRGWILLVSTILFLALALMAAGTTALLIRHGLRAAPVAVPTGVCWLITLLAIKNLIKPKPLNPAALERHATIMSPMQITFDEDRIIIEMPIGRSTYRYSDATTWYETEAAYYLKATAKSGLFVIPRRFVAPEMLPQVEEHLRTRGAKVKKTKK